MSTVVEIEIAGEPPPHAETAAALPTSGEQAIRTLLDTWLQGRKVLVVLGAGASVAAGIPLMPTVYGRLKEMVDELRPPEVPDNSFLLQEVRGNLDAVMNSEGSRACAAMALGTLQKAHKHSLQPEDLHGKLATIWNRFSDDFIKGRIAQSTHRTDKAVFSGAEMQRTQDVLCKHSFAGNILELANEERKRKDAESANKSDAGTKAASDPVPLHQRPPTDLHYLIAQWAANDWARVVSVNFDGLTQKALRSVLKNRNNRGASSVVLSEPEALRSFVFGDSPHTSTPTAIVKVWGDVFHAVCTNARCPDNSKRVPIFRLEAEASHISRRTPSTEPEHLCPSCGQLRQLQIFFTGYEEKERLTHDLMEELLRSVAPEIGCILTIGFSGAWDQALVKFIATLSKLLARENKATRPSAVPCICVDRHKFPPLVHDLESHGVTPCHVRAKAEEFAGIFAIAGQEVTRTQVEDIPRYSSSEGAKPKADGLWDKDAGVLQALPGTYKHFFGASSDPYLGNLEFLRQLGIKTKISFAMQGKGQEKGLEEKDHNRLKHSHGAAHLAALWFRRLAAPLVKKRVISEILAERLCSMTVFAALHHDSGHLPFTHLAEEIFDEVHWWLHDWDSPFKHDEPVLALPLVTSGTEVENHKGQVERALQSTAKELNVEPNLFRHWTECALQGRSGYPWIDAILNSPLDADKLDYVFRDCTFLKQQLHIPLENGLPWIEQIFDECRVLPSGLVALQGSAGRHARDFLEERWWLYRRQYNRPGFRAIERIARAVIIQWLLSRVPSELSADELMTDPERPMRDPSAIKGKHARRLLWKCLLKLTAVNDGAATTERRNHGEPELLLQMVKDIQTPSPTGIPQSARVVEWAQECEKVFQVAFKPQAKGEDNSGYSLTEFLRKEAGITHSSSIYVGYERLSEIREVARHLETSRPFRALIDIAVFPRMLAYPGRRRYTWNNSTVIGECFAVSNRDPDRWGQPTNSWLPLSESALAERDKKRWAKIMVVSPYEDDPEVWHMMDRFRNECRHLGIQVVDIDPERAVDL